MRTTLKILILLIYSFATVLAKAQDYNYIHYTNKDGLAGNTVYGVAQDKDGYMFFATENGLSRFDGKEWKTFTVKDGLPDNEVLVIFGDSRGRVWLGTFNKSICYYYKGVIHNNLNDSIIKKINLTSLLFKIHEIENGDIILSTNESIIDFKNDGTVAKILTNNQDIAGYDFFAEKNLIAKGSFLRKGNRVFLFDGENIYDSIVTGIFYNFNRMLPVWQQMNNLDSFSKFNSFYSNASNINSIDLYSEDVGFLNTNNGTWLLSNQGSKQFLPNIKTGHAFIDAENSFWITTLGNGIYKVQSDEVKSFSLPKIKGNPNKEVFAITGCHNNIYAGASYGKLLSIKVRKQYLLDFQPHIQHSLNRSELNRLTTSIGLNDKALFLGFDSYIAKFENSHRKFNYKIIAIKSIENIDGNYILVASKHLCLKLRSCDLKVVDTLFPQRSTYANYLNHQYYIGTTNGLFIVNESKQQSYLGNIHPALKRRITCIKNYNNCVYVATADAGIVVLYNNKVVAAINDSMGLSSNSVKTLHISGTTLWVGTIKGVNKIDLNTNKVITKYSTSDGLPSDIINAIYYDNTDSTVWVGSTEGLTYFKEKDILGQSMCNLVMENITVSKTNINRDSNNLSLKYNDNIQFQFVGISLRSGDEILYHYKLQGLDANFNTTTERFLSYPSLPSGNYTLQLYATNKFGVKSKTYTCTFTVAPPFWKTWWFYTLELSVFAFIIWIILYTRFKRKQKEYKLNADFKVLLADMEQQALQAQMNPHFIFNSLNSIQQFMLQNDKQQANKYLTSFATLIRKTLDYSAKKSISLTDEIDYLNQYVALELLRFNNSFTYTINVNDDLEVDLIKIPALLLQPFVENAIRHGIRNKPSNDGVLLIDFKMLDDNLICTIEDNGIGRKKAQEIKSTTHIEYQSKGLDITQKRITLLNTKPDNKFDIQIIDLMNDNVAIGTRVVVTIAV